MKDAENHEALGKANQNHNLISLYTHQNAGKKLKRITSDGKNVVKL